MKETKLIEYLEGILSFLSGWRISVLSYVLKGLEKPYIVTSLKKIDIEPVKKLV